MPQGHHIPLNLAKIIKRGCYETVLHECVTVTINEYIYEEFKIYAKTNISIFINLRYLRFKLLKNKENNKKVCYIFHNFKNIPCYVTREVSLKRFYFALFDDGLIYTLKTLKLAYIGFAFKLFIYCQVNLNLMFTRP